MIFAPLAAAWIGAVALALLDGRRPAVRIAAISAIAVTMGLTIRLAMAVAAQGRLEVTSGGWPEGLGITLAADPLGLPFALVSQGALIAALMHHAFAGEPSERLPGFVLFMNAGLTGLFLTADAFNFYVFFEVSVASAFGMTAHGRRRREVTAGFLFVTLNIFGSLILLFAIGGLYRLTGTLHFEGVAAGLAGQEAPLATGIAALLLAAFSIKLGLFPFHTWLPDVYRDLRPEVAAVFSGALANIGSYALLRFGAGLMPAEIAYASTVLLVIGGASILYGGVAAIGAGTPNAVLAWSAVGQAGYVLVALALGTTAALTAAVVYALITAANKTLLFLATGLRGPAVAAAFAAGAFSLAGVPPFAGFTAKVAVFRGAIHAAEWTTLFVLVLGSALSFVYIFPIFQQRYWSDRSSGEPPSPRPARALAVVLATLLGAAGVWPEPMLRAAAAASRSLPLIP